VQVARRTWILGTVQMIFKEVVEISFMLRSAGQTTIPSRLLAILGGLAIEADAFVMAV
jgi:hypothetical protein